MKTIPFNKPYLSGSELDYIQQAVASGRTAGNSHFTKKCHQFFSENYGFHNSLLTTSCTDALEMSAILAEIQPGDEVIMPSYTFVSTANAFVLRGAKIVFADSSPDHPNLDARIVEELITERTVAIVVVHYAGVACEMNEFQRLCSKYNLYLIEDAAQGIDSYYIHPETSEKTPLGGIGDLAAFSFHETKNIISGEGGMLVVNREELVRRSEIIWEKGTNRSAFFRGEVDKYGWVDVGSSFLPSDITAAFLYGQLEHIHDIQKRRLDLWNQYANGLADLDNAGLIQTPKIPAYATNNAHMFYMVLSSGKERRALLKFLKERGIHAVFHYLSLHKSPFFAEKHDGRSLPNCDHFADCLVRLPLFYELSDADQSRIVDEIKRFFKL